MPSKVRNEASSRTALQQAVINLALARVALEAAERDWEDAMLAASLDGVTQTEIAAITGLYQPRVSVLIARAKERADGTVKP